MVYRLGDIIGRGSDGVVYELIEGDNKDKIIKFIQGENYGIKNYLEYYILFNLDEKYISKALAIEIEKDGLIKIIQKKALMDLKDYSIKNKLTIKNKKSIFLQLVNGLNYLHSLNIIHGDIKPSNILVFPHLNVKYSDFNLSTLYMNDTTFDKNFYTITFRGPEVLAGKTCLKSDIWALGCTLFEIYYGYAYFNFRANNKFYHIKNSKEDKEDNNIFNDLIRNMINENLEKRFDISEVIKHNFFNNLSKNFDNFQKIKIINNFELDNIMTKNYNKYQIIDKNHKKIFTSKFLSKNIPTSISNNYRNIEQKINENKFNLYI